MVASARASAASKGEEDTGLRGWIWPSSPPSWIGECIGRRKPRLNQNLLERKSNSSEGRQGNLWALEMDLFDVMLTLIMDVLFSIEDPSFCLTKTSITDNL
jgi:hypothetical protein